MDYTGSCLTHFMVALFCFQAFYGIGCCRLNGLETDKHRNFPPGVSTDMFLRKIFYQKALVGIYYCFFNSLRKGYFRTVSDIA